jgi:hypothetical protein
MDVQKTNCLIAIFNLVGVINKVHFTLNLFKVTVFKIRSTNKKLNNKRPDQEEEGDYLSYQLSMYEFLVEDHFQN